MTTQETTVRTSSAQALTDLQAAAREVELSARLYADRHTAEAKKALRAARAEYDRLLRNYSRSRMLLLESAARRVR